MGRAQARAPPIPLSPLVFVSPMGPGRDPGPPMGRARDPGPPYSPIPPLFHPLYSLHIPYIMDIFLRPPGHV